MTNTRPILRSLLTNRSLLAASHLALVGSSDLVHARVFCTYLRLLGFPNLEPRVFLLSDFITL